MGENVITPLERQCAIFRTRSAVNKISNHFIKPNGYLCSVSGGAIETSPFSMVPARKTIISESYANDFAGGHILNEGILRLGLSTIESLTKFRSCKES